MATRQAPLRVRDTGSQSGPRDPMKWAWPHRGLEGRELPASALLGRAQTASALPWDFPAGA